MTRAITRVAIDKDSGHAPSYGQAVAWSINQLAQQKNLSGTPSEKAKGPYAGSGDVLIGTEILGEEMRNVSTIEITLTKN